MPKPSVELPPEVIAEMDRLARPMRVGVRGELVFGPVHDAFIRAAMSRNLSYRATAKLFKQQYGWGCVDTIAKRARELEDV